MNEPSPPNAENRAAASPVETPRRSLLAGLTILTGAAATAAAGVPIAAYLAAPLIEPKPDQWVDVGAIDDFTQQETSLVYLRNPLARPVDGDAGKLAAYVRRTGSETFQVFAINCTHLGCPVNWFPDAGLFMCPCHGGVYYSDGARASGPPPRGLYEYEYRIDKERLLVRLGHLPTLQQPA